MSQSNYFKLTIEVIYDPVKRFNVASCRCYADSSTCSICLLNNRKESLCIAKRVIADPGFQNTYPELLI